MNTNTNRSEPEELASAPRREISGLPLINPGSRLWGIGVQLCLSVVVVLGVFVAVSLRADDRPNLIVIMVDDMGYGDAACYGGTAYPTPNLDRLAREGMKFTDYHSSGPVCSPTRAGLLTGRYQQRAGVAGVIYAPFKKNRHHGLQMKEITFAEVLRGVGYRTGMFGKWHLGYEEQYNPVHQGFEEYVGYVSGNVDFHRHIDGAGVFDWWHQNKKTRESGYTTHLITKHAVDFIKANREEPFCLYIAHEAPHDPYQGPNDPPVRNEGETQLIYNHREPQHAARAYREMMIEMDKGVGEVLDMLEQLDLTKNTFVMFFSDNGATGPGSCAGLYGMKGTLWEGGHRVPSIARWPGRIKAGSETDQLAITIDVMPTLLDLAGVELPGKNRFDGMSLAPLLFGKAKPKPRQLFWQYGNARSMRDGDWKLVIDGGKPGKKDLPNIDWNRPQDGREKLALFDLGKSPKETHNLADNYPRRVAAMKKALAAWESEVAEYATIQPDKKD
jgi:arylsulfatase A